MSTCPDASSSADNATVRDRTAEARKELLLHLGIHRFPGHRPSERTTDADILFWVELSPNSKAGDKKCTLNCGRRIFPGDYRIALNPGQKGVALENGLGWWYGPGDKRIPSFAINISLIRRQQIITMSSASRRSQTLPKQISLTESPQLLHTV